MPADGEVFELTLDGDAPENQPLEMVRQAGYDNWQEWEHNGPAVKGRETRRFKWVYIGYQPNLDAVRAALATHGKIPEGQWREAVKKMFKHDIWRPCGIADPSWEPPRFGGSIPYCPYISSDGSSRFKWVIDGFPDHWRWLVEVNE